MDKKDLKQLFQSLAEFELVSIHMDKLKKEIIECSSVKMSNIFCRGCKENECKHIFNYKNNKLDLDEASNVVSKIISKNGVEIAKLLNATKDDFENWLFAKNKHINEDNVDVTELIDYAKTLNIEL